MSTNESPNDAKSLNLPGLGLFEKIWEAEWALRLVFGVLLLDLALIHHGGHGVLAWSVSTQALMDHAGALLAAAATISFFAAIVIPIVASLVGQLIHVILSILPMWMDPRDFSTYQRPLGYVLSSQFRKHALAEQSSFLLKIYEDREQSRKATDERRDRIGVLVFTDLLLAIADATSRPLTGDAASLVSRALDSTGTLGNIMAACIALGACAVLKQWWLPDHVPDVIYYPPLDAQLRTEEQAKNPSRLMPLTPSPEMANDRDFDA